jgi:xylulokinase
VLEGVAFGIKDSFTLIQQTGLGSIDQVRVSGGGARSPLWRQIMADVLGVELVTVNTTEGAAFGAALLAAVGAGLYPDVESATQAAIQITGRTAPSAQAGQYPAVYTLYRSLYPALTGAFQDIARLVGV